MGWCRLFDELNGSGNGPPGRGTAGSGPGPDAGHPEQNQPAMNHPSNPTADSLVMAIEALAVELREGLDDLPESPR